MSIKRFFLVSWTLWGLLSASAILILIANFIFQIAIKTDAKVTTAMNAVFIILNTIILTFVLILIIWNITGQKINWSEPINISSWILLFLYIIFANSSSILILNNDYQFYIFKAAMTMLSFIIAILFFPIIVFKFISKLKLKKSMNYLIITVLVIYLIINLLLNFVILLNVTKEIAFLATVTTLNLIFSILFSALLTKNSTLFYKKNFLNFKPEPELAKIV